METEAAAVRDDKEKGPCQSNPDSGWEDDKGDVDVSLLGARSTSGLQKTQLLGSQRRVGLGMLFQGAGASRKFSACCGHSISIWAPMLPWRGLDAHEHLLAPSWRTLPWRNLDAHKHLLAPGWLPPAWLIQSTGRPCPSGRALGSPAPPHYLMEFLIVHLCPVQLRRMRSMPARPRFSTSKQRPVPLFMMAPFWMKFHRL